MQTLNSDTQAILLFTAYFGKPAEGEPKPLTPTEWGRFASWLKDRNTRPGELLADGLSKALPEWQDRTISLARLQALLDRGAALAIAVEKWQRTGIWIMTRSDPDYPVRLKQRLENQAPPVLFGCGNRRLLNNGGIAVVGSRNAKDKDLDFARTIGKKVAASGMTIISGGARGVDEAAMLGTLEVEGTVIGVLADSLLRAAVSQKYRQAIRQRNLVLVSPFNPEAGFSAGNAMARNKYIYCMSDAAVVVESGKSGGTWNGATENLKKRWVPLWVKISSDLEFGFRPVELAHHRKKLGQPMMRRDVVWGKANRRPQLLLGGLPIEIIAFCDHGPSGVRVAQPGVDLNGSFDRLLGQRERLLHWIVAGASAQQVTIGQPGVCRGVIRVRLGRLLEILDRQFVSVCITLVPIVAAQQVISIG